MWVRKSTPRPSRARPTATLSGLPPTCSPRIAPSRSTMSIRASPMTSARCCSVIARLPLAPVLARTSSPALRAWAQRSSLAFVFGWTSLRILSHQGLQRRPCPVAVQRIQRPYIRLDEPAGGGEISEYIGVFDERGRIVPLRAGQRHERVGELILDVDSVTLFVDALRVARPAGHRRRR